MIPLGKVLTINKIVSGSPYQTGVSDTNIYFVEDFGTVAKIYLQDHNLAVEQFYSIETRAVIENMATTLFTITDRKTNKQISLNYLKVLNIYTDKDGYAIVVYKQYLDTNITRVFNALETEAQITQMINDLQVDPLDVAALLNQSKILTIYEVLTFTGSSTGTVTAPPTSTILPDHFGTGVAVTSTETSGVPNFVSPTDIWGNKITATIDNAGNVVLSQSYTGNIAIIYGVDITFQNYSTLSQAWLDKIIDSDVNDPNNPFKEEEYFTINGSDPLPVLSAGADLVYIDIDNMVAEYDLTGWIPVNLNSHAIIRVRKIDTSPYKITFNDGIHNYKFINCKGELIELTYNGSSLKI